MGRSLPVLSGAGRAACALAAMIAILVPAVASADSTSVTFSGDLRYRHENTWRENSSDVMRHRIRMRFAAKAKVSDDLAVTMRISTAGSGPASTNETLEDAFNRKPLAIDLAYLAWTPLHGHGGLLSRSAIWAGKMKRPFYRPAGSQLFWDSDVTPEGIAAVIGEPKDGAPGLFMNAGMYWIDEESGDDGTELFAVQAGPRFTFGETVTTTVGGGYYYYSGDAVQWWTNNDYEVAEAFADMTVGVSDRSFTLFGHFARNTAAEDQEIENEGVTIVVPADNTGWLAGVVINDAPVSLTYCYRHVEGNAVPSLFTDSDFASGVDTEGHTISLGWDVRQHVELVVTGYVADIDLSAPESFSRLQAQIIVSF